MEVPFQFVVEHSPANVLHASLPQSDLNAVVASQYERRSLFCPRRSIRSAERVPDGTANIQVSFT